MTNLQPLGQRVIEGAKDALAHAKGDASRVIVHEPREVGVSDAPAEELTPEMRRIVENNARALRETLTSLSSGSSSPGFGEVRLSERTDATASER